MSGKIVLITGAIWRTILSTSAEEAYHFKDAGWFSLDHPEYSERHDQAARRKLIKGIAALGLPHKYPLPKEFTEE